MSRIFIYVNKEPCDNAKAEIETNYSTTKYI